MQRRLVAGRGASGDRRRLGQRSCESSRSDLLRRGAKLAQTEFDTEIKVLAHLGELLVAPLGVAHETAHVVVQRVQPVP